MESLLKITSGLNSFLIKINRRRILHRFRLRQNAPLGNLFIVLSFSAVQASKTSFQIAEEWTIKRSRF